MSLPKPFVQDEDFTLYCGDSLAVLRELPDESVHCALTSPPFYALRNYGVDGQIGLEATPEAWVDSLVAVFAELRRVLRSDGTLWVECGDSYCANTQGSPKPNANTKGHVDGWVPNSWGGGQATVVKHPTKPKDILLQPFMLAMALRGEGWWLRQVIIWEKPNAMPESVSDRCTTAHSYIFLLSKSARYHFDADAISEPAEWAAWGRQTDLKRDMNGSEGARGTGIGFDTYGRQKIRELAGLNAAPQEESLLVRAPNKQDAAAAAAAGNIASERRYEGFNERWKQSGRKGNGQRERSEEMRGFDERTDRADGRKNPRSVWTIPTQGFSEAHFATWPEALVERILKAGCPVDGTCLDPFGGSGTTALVARRLGRKSILIELNADYCRMAARRLQQLSLLA